MAHTFRFNNARDSQTSVWSVLPMSRMVRRKDIDERAGLKLKRPEEVQ